MSVRINNPVEIPSKGVQKRKIKNTIYAYYATKCYRNEKGQPTCDRVCIGKIDEKENKLIPNRNYYEVFNQQPIAFTDTIVKYGVYGVFKELSDRYGLTDVLEQAFPKNYKEILTTAHYMLYGDSALYLMESWSDEYMTFSKKVLSSPVISQMLEEINVDNCNRFFREWIAMRKSKELIAYDVTSISTYSRNIEDAEWGYNRDKESLPQINYGMFMGQESLLPLYYRTYPGSITDKVHLKYMTEDTEMLDLKHAYFVMDKGFYTEDNLRTLALDKGIRFIIPVPGSHLFYNEMIDKHGKEIANNYDCFLDEEICFGKKYEVNKYGFRMNVHIFYNPEKAPIEIASFKARLEEMKKDLSEMEVAPSKNTNFAKYFDITQKDGYLVFTENIDAINKELSRCGYFMFAETVFELKTLDVLHTYRRRDTIEKCFDNLKNELDIKRIRCHRSKTMNGKMFTSFISLIIRSAIERDLSDYLRKKKYSMAQALMELDKIKVIYAPSKPNGYRLLNPLTKTQKEILGNLNIPENFVD